MLHNSRLAMELCPCKYLLTHFLMTQQEEAAPVAESAPAEETPAAEPKQEEKSAEVSG